MVFRKDDYMIKYRLLIALICLCVFGNFYVGIRKSYAHGSEKLTLTYDNVTRVDVSANGLSYLQHQKYNYSTSLRNEIACILNYINNFNLEYDEKKLNANDISSYSVKIYMIDGSMKKYGFYAERFYDDCDRQYTIDSSEYECFLDFVNALKTKKIILDDEVKFDSSEWAKSDIDKAIKKELVPKLNQINYKGKINRLEVCQLIYNLLDKQNSIKLKKSKNPFSDTTDKSIITLYNYGIIDGKSESEFAPYDYVTREELSKVLSNTCYFMKLEVGIGNYAHVYVDQEEISSWALDYVDNMYLLNIMMGNQENEFRPHANITKEELIITLLRIYSKIE